MNRASRQALAPGEPTQRTKTAAQNQDEKHAYAFQPAFSLQAAATSLAAAKLHRPRDRSTGIDVQRGRRVPARALWILELRAQRIKG